MIKAMPLPEVLKRAPSVRGAELVQAARDTHYLLLHGKMTPVAYRDPWQPVGYLVSSGARIEVRPWGGGFRWRLNGYAHDGSDVE